MVGCGGPTEAATASKPAIVTVAAPDGVTVCEGTRRWAEQETERVIDATGLVPASPLRIELGVTAVATQCGEQPVVGVRLGCALGNRGETRAYAEAPAFAHELSHALRRQYELATMPLLEEGFAEAVNGSDPYPSTVILEPIDTQVDVAAAVTSGAAISGASPYRAATHFVRWMFARHGQDEFAAFMRGGIDKDGAAAAGRFADAFGEDITVAADAWHDDAAGLAVRGRLCPEALPTESLPRTLEGRVDCGQPDTFGLSGPDERAWVRQCFVLDVEPVEVTVEGGPGFVRLEVDPASCGVPVEDPSRRTHEIAAGETKALDLAACPWSATFVADGLPTASLRLQITAR